MGCDIHAMIEKKGDYYSWVNCGDPELSRNYELFAVLADVRNADDIPCIVEPRGIPKDCCDEFDSWRERWDGDAHSISWITLEEIKAFDLEQEVNDTRLVLSRNEEGEITGCCAGTTGAHMGPVGKRKIFGLWGKEFWDNLIKKMEGFGEDDKVRLVFFFDN